MVVSLAYMKRNFCEKCFSRLFEKRVRKTIRKNKLLQGKDRRVGVALSGGKDSVVLLKILHELSEKAPHSELVAISVDEGISIKKKSLAIAKKFCQELEVKQHIFSFQEEFGITLPKLMKKVSKLENPAPACSYCGTLRRKLLNEKGFELKVDKLATGHNLDDEVQAALMNFIRADFERMARAGALVGVVRNEKFVPKIKPLRDSLENEILSYAKINKLPFFKVSCHYSEDAFRKTIREALDKIEKKHPGSKFQLLHSLDTLIPILRKDARTGRIKICRKCGSLTSGEICQVCQMREELGF